MWMMFSVSFWNFIAYKEDLIKKGRKKEISHPRQVMMFLLRDELQMPFSAIGEVLGGRDHTTALHAFEKINMTKRRYSRVSKKNLAALKERLYYPS